MLRVKGTRKALVVATDAQRARRRARSVAGRRDGRRGGARNIAVTGARPLGVTNCLNYGDPTRPEAFWQLQEGVRGLGDACRALGLAVTGGNVCLYNESAAGRHRAHLRDRHRGAARRTSRRWSGPAFRGAGDSVLLVGHAGPGLAGATTRALAGAAAEDGPPALDLAAEAALRRFSARPRRGLVASAQDVSGGGLAVALAECAMWGGVGAPHRVAVAGAPAVELFGESPSRVVVDGARRGMRAALARWPASTGCRSRRSARPAATGCASGSAGEGATGAAEERGCGRRGRAR